MKLYWAAKKCQWPLSPFLAMDYRNFLPGIKVTSFGSIYLLLTSICYLNNVSWNVSVYGQGLKSRPAGINFYTKGKRTKKNIFFSEKRKKMLMVVASLIKILQKRVASH